MAPWYQLRGWNFSGVLIKIQLHMKLIISSEMNWKICRVEDWRCVGWNWLKSSAYPCRSSGIVSSIKAILSRLKPPALKLMPPDDRLLKFPASVMPCRSKVPKGFFVLADFVSFKFSVKFWRNMPPPPRNEGREINLVSFSITKLNGNCLWKFFTFSCFITD